MNPTPNRPPILRFLILFVSMVASALVLAALSPAVESTPDGAEAATGTPRDSPATAEAPRSR